MSGLEVAGVVLGALPLVISALEHYSQGINTAERYWRYKTEFGSLTLQIKTEHHIFLNTLEQLLTGIVRIEHMAQLVEDPASNAWRDPELDGMLKGRLRSAYDVYLDNVRVMEAALRTMMEKLALDPDGKPQFTDPTLFKQEYKRLKFSLNKSEYSEQLSALKSHNLSLSSLTKQSLDLEPTRNESKARSCPNFKALQSYARDFYDTLKLGLRCAAGCPDHAVKLRLENRNRKVDTEDLPENTPFRVIFIHASNGEWKEADIRCLRDKPKLVHLSSGTPTSIALPPTRTRVTFGSLECQVQQASSTRTSIMTICQQHVSAGVVSDPVLEPERIQNLCQTIGQLHQATTAGCIGYLLDSVDRKHGVYPHKLPGSCQQQPSTSYTLRQILTKQTRTDMRLTQHDKLRIAVYLASSVLQLYKTPWLDENWDHGDVHFVHRPNAEATSILEQPYIHRKLIPTAPNQPLQTQQVTFGIVRNQTLFALGILLIELWYGKPMEDLVEAGDIDYPGTPGVMWYTAERLIKTDIEFEAGKRYADVVRRCIRCDFDRMDSNLGDESFQRAVFDKVVTPLEITLQQFSSLD